MRGYLKAGVAAMAVLAEQAFAMKAAANHLNHQIGPGRKTHKRLTDGTVSTDFAGGQKSRQVERAEGRAELKRMDRFRAQRAREDNAAWRRVRVDKREKRELDRRDARFSVHEIIERGAFGQFRRSRFA